MFCHNCGKELKPNANFCSNCRTEVIIIEQKDIKETLLFISSIIACGLTILAFNTIVIITGIIFGIIGLVGGIVYRSKNKTSKKSLYTIALGISGIAIHITWYLFIMYVL